MTKEKTRIVSLNELQTGMVIARDLEKNGQILLKKDLKITEPIINQLKKVLLTGDVIIYDLKQNEKLQSKKEEEYNRIEEEFRIMSSGLQKTFKQISNEDSNSISEVREFCKSILNSSNIVIKNIVLHGSGIDSIYRHGVNVAALSALLGKWLGLEDAELNLLVYSAMLHDLGKIEIQKDVLNKNELLDSDEFDIIKTHAQIGYNVIKEIPFIDESVSYGVLMHHEREDGSGYPLGLKGGSIHMFAKIIAIADVFDAINSNRAYKKKRPPFEALQIVKTESLGKLNYEYVKVFLEHIVNYYLGEEVLLNTGETCKIIQMNLNNIEKPLVLKGEEFIDLDKRRDLYIQEMLL